MLRTPKILDACLALGDRRWRYTRLNFHQISLDVAALGQIQFGCDWPCLLRYTLPNHRCHGLSENYGTKYALDSMGRVCRAPLTRLRSDVHKSPCTVPARLDRKYAAPVGRAIRGQTIIASATTRNFEGLLAITDPARTPRAWRPFQTHPASLARACVAASQGERPVSVRRSGRWPLPPCGPES